MGNKLAPSVNDVLYTTVQEGLTNIRKHAQAERAAVYLDDTQASRECGRSGGKNRRCG